MTAKKANDSIKDVSFVVAKTKMSKQQQKSQGICLNPGCENHWVDRSLRLDHLWWWQNSKTGGLPCTSSTSVTDREQWQDKAVLYRPCHRTDLVGRGKHKEPRRRWLYTEVSDCSLMTNLWLFGSINSSPSRKNGSCVTVTTREKSRWRREKTIPWRRAEVTGSSLTNVHWRPLPFWCWYCIVGPEAR